jgi:hypothetical protein
MKNYKSLICTLVLLFLFINMYSQKKAQSALKPYNIDWTTGNQTDFDLSHLLEKPAGAAGFIQIKNGHFYTADGKG